MTEESPRDDAYHLAGDRLGKFVILHELGRGSMGVVYEAFQEDLKRKVALKILPANITLDPKQVRRFRREAESMARLQHENIIPVYEVGTIEGTHYFAMKMVDGRPLGEQIGRDRESIREAARLGVQAARGLAHAHSHGVVHRDIKPGNLLVDRDGKLLLTDFGLAHLTDSASLTSTDAIVGTPKYMSPEQILPGRRPLDGRTDVYALGATLYEVCAGRAPFEEPSVQAFIKAVLESRPASPRRFNRQIPHDLATILLRCLEKDPEDRYATADDLADDLERFYTGERIRARPKGSFAIAFETVRRHKVISALAAAALLGLLFTLMLGGEVEKARLSSRLNERLNRIQAERDLDLAVQEIEELAAKHPRNPTVAEVRRLTYLRHAEQSLGEKAVNFESVIESLDRAGARDTFWHLMALVEGRRFDQVRKEAAELPRTSPLRGLADARLEVEEGRFEEAIRILDRIEPPEKPVQFMVYRFLALGRAYTGYAEVKDLPAALRRARYTQARTYLDRANRAAQAIHERWLRSRIQLLLYDVRDRLHETVNPRDIVLDGAAAVQETLRILTRWWSSMTPNEAELAQEFLDRVLALAKLKGLTPPELEKEAKTRLAAATRGKQKVIANLLLAVARLSRGRIRLAGEAMDGAEDALYAAKDARLGPYVAWGRSIVFRADNDIGQAVEWAVDALDRALSVGGRFPDFRPLARHALLMAEEAARRNQDEVARSARQALTAALGKLTGGSQAWVTDLLKRLAMPGAPAAPPR